MPANNIKIKIVNPAAVKADNLFLPLYLGKLHVFKKQYNRTGNEYGRIRAKHDADQQRKSQIVEYRPTEQIQRGHS
jgi:hypothetical protein